MRFFRRNAGLVLVVLLLAAAIAFGLFNALSNAPSPVLTLDGEVIYEQDGDLYIIPLSAAPDAEPSRVGNLVTTEERRPRVSQNGERIVLEQQIGDSSNIYVISTRNGNGVSLTRNTNSETAPAWSPDATQIVFVGDADGSRSLYTMNNDGNNVRPLTDANGNEDDPAWSPDGASIAYVSDRGGNNDLYVLDLASCTVDENDVPSCNSRQLTAGAGNDSHPHWSPDGRTLVFASDSGNGYALFTLRLRDNAITQLTSGANDRAPYWSPEGERILFVSDRDGGGIFVYDMRNENWLQAWADEGISSAAWLLRPEVLAP